MLNNIWLRHFINRKTLSCITFGGKIERDLTDWIEIKDSELFTKFYNINSIEDKKKFLKDNKISLKEILNIEEFRKKLNTGKWDSKSFNLATKSDLIEICKYLSKNINDQKSDNLYLSNNNKILDENLKNYNNKYILDTDKLLKVISDLKIIMSRMWFIIGIESIILIIILLINIF